MNRSLTISQKRGLVGVLFLAPWLIGFLLLFVTPAIQSLQFSLSKLTITQEGFTTQFVGLANYKEALYVNANYNRDLTDSVVQMVVNVPLILFFSLFSATLVNQKYRGRTIVRAIFFLPVVVASGAIASAEAGNLMNQMMMAVTRGGASDVAGASTGQLTTSMQMAELMMNSGIGQGFANYLLGAVDQIYQIISNSGIQILIFLAGLQSIPSSMYEVAKIDGATGYQMFWKITFPMVSPLILTNVIYTIIDSFSNNRMTQTIYDAAFRQLNFGLSSAMVWMYTLVVAVILAIIGYFVSKRVFYNS